MSYQAYLDAVEAKTGKTPQELLDEATTRGFDASTQATVVVNWLKDDYGLGRGHAMAFFGVLKNGLAVPEKYVGATGSHRDETPLLRLDGIADRASWPALGLTGGLVRSPGAAAARRGTGPCPR